MLTAVSVASVGVLLGCWTELSLAAIPSEDLLKPDVVFAFGETCRRGPAFLPVVEAFEVLDVALEGGDDGVDLQGHSAGLAVEVVGGGGSKGAFADFEGAYGVSIFEHSKLIYNVFNK